MEMDQEKLFALLGQLVASNEAVLEQNRQLLAFLQKRDAGVDERTKLEVERIGLEIVNLRHVAWHNGQERAKFDRELEVYRELGTSMEEQHRLACADVVQVRKETAQWRAAAPERAAKAEARRASSREQP